ncbi:hypothetical protein FPSE_11261, partial [Fusarium pseudograminearum CS3096]
IIILLLFKFLKNFYFKLYYKSFYI